MQEIFKTKAMPLAGGEFLDRLRFLVDAWLPARKHVERVYEKRFEVHPSGHIMEFNEEKGDVMVPWKEHLFAIEQAEAPKVIYCLFVDDNGNWRILVRFF